MTNLLKLQFYRLVRDRSMLVQTLITLGIAIFYVFIYFFVNESIKSLDTGSTGESFINIGMLIFLAFQQSSVPLIMINVMNISYVAKEMRYGTIRNQVVSGYSKTEIFFADSILIGVISFALLFLYQIVTILTGLAFQMPLGIDASNAAAFFGQYAMSCLCTFAIVCFTCFIAMNVTQMGLAIVLSTVVPVVGTLSITLLTQFIPDMLMVQANRELLEWVYFYQSYALVNLNSFSLSSGLSVPGDYMNGLFFMKTAIVSIVLSGGFLALGAYLFANKDLK